MEDAVYFPEDFNRATLSIANASEDCGRSVGTKNDWYCLCLENYAHHSNFDHPIFKGPFKVNIKEESRPTPVSALDYAKMYGETLPAMTDMWHVHDYMLDKDGKKSAENRIGMVSRPVGYLDSPEAEIISSGECGKSIDAVAIGRQGPWFHWGFVAAPSMMTKQAKDVLANAIVYASKFNGKNIIARKKEEGIFHRHDLLGKKYLLSKEAWKENEKMNYDFWAATDSIICAVQAKKAAGEPLDAGDFFFADFDRQPQPEPQPYLEYLRDKEPDLFPIFGADYDEYIRYYEKNLPYVYPKDVYYPQIDQEAKYLGIANNDIKILDRCISMLEKGEEPKLAKNILERYTLVRFDTPQQWRAWFEKNKDKLFFSESGGWLWLLDTEDPTELTNDYSRIMKVYYADGPRGPKENRVTAFTDNRWANMTAPAAEEAPAQKDELATTDIDPVAFAAEANDGVITLTMKIHPGFHTYAVVDPEDPFVQTKVTFELPEGMTKSGKMTMPNAQATGNQTSYFVGEGKFVQKVTGKGDVTVKIHYQACNDNGCLRPTTKEVKVTVK